MAGVAFAGDGDGVGFATESYTSAALYTTLANLSGAFWRIRRVSFLFGCVTAHSTPLVHTLSRFAGTEAYVQARAEPDVQTDRGRAWLGRRPGAATRRRSLAAGSRSSRPR